jgi:hypothetical protein
MEKNHGSFSFYARRTPRFAGIIPGTYAIPAHHLLSLRGLFTYGSANSFAEQK